MSAVIWQSSVSRVGGDAGEMIAAGVLILFGEPVPDALADVSVVHSGASGLTRGLQTGDEFRFAELTYSVDEVGFRAAENLTELGHLVIYINQPDQELLPGAVKASGPELVIPAVGSELSFRGGVDSSESA